MRLPLKFGAMKGYLLVLVLACALVARSQDFTTGFSGGFTAPVGAKVAVVPFEPRMILNDLHRDMCQKNGMNTQQVREALAGAFCYAMRESAPELTESDVFGWDDPWPQALERLYKELGYRNTAIHPSESSSEPVGTYLEMGELRHRLDTMTRFMQPVIDTAVVRELASEMGSDFVLLVSQLDIVNLGELVRIQPGKTAFFVRLHYAFYNAEGKYLKGGLVSEQLETATYNPHDLTRKEFTKVTSLLYEALRNHLPQPAVNEDAAEPGDFTGGK